ncbi:AAR2 protein [Necator americanus]|uniref:Protein AAR2 homolog n=1 Tax=Necator americanus TaxID=51031 RepID=W2SQ23_NECAM|nr:AAR2 protein [Necator americanus]ETN70767.1 AAR2 protein [Necator americanus]
MAFHILHTLKHGAELPPEVVNYMYSTGAFMILKDFPEGHEFGIDYKSWTVGPKFMGLKMIPAGVHFVYCSVKGAPRIGEDFDSEEIVVKKWDKQKEAFSDEIISDEEEAFFFLRLNPLKGKISAQAELVSMETCLMENEELNATVGCSNSVDREHPVRTRFVDQEGLPIMKIREGYEIRFSPIPQLRADEKRVGIDYTDRLERLIRQLNGDWKQLLAEVQFAFACFLIGQVFEGFEQWKRFIHLLCCCPSALGSLSEMFISFIRVSRLPFGICIQATYRCLSLVFFFVQVLFFELKECPTDFFVDIVSRDNFLTTTLSMLFANIRDSDCAPPELKKKSMQFKTYLTKEFKWDFECD